MTQNIQRIMVLTLHGCTLSMASVITRVLSLPLCVCVYVCVSTEMKFIALLNIQIQLLCLFTYCCTEVYRNKE